MRRHFVRKAGFFFFLWFALLFAAGALSMGWFFGRGRGGHGFFLPPPLVAFGIFVVILLVTRGIRRAAAPIGDVMEAADRLADGDYGARVEVRGQPEVRNLARSFNAMAERLSAADRQRRNILADVAHELRTPLAVIQGNLEAILDGVYPLDAQHLAPVLEETKVMSRLLEDLHTLSTAEVGGLRLRRAPVLPEELVEAAVAAFRPQAKSSGVGLVASVAPGLPGVSADADRVAEVFANLLGNALRYTPTGGSIVVGAARSEADGVTFWVRDSGSGIPPDLLPHIFERFARDIEAGGAGLGLPIAKSIVEAHGGAMTAESEPGRGTTLRFTLPPA
jgi:two-component system OmpR family sensor kinase/two-component system sensor histidine kinase BaeS